MDSSTCRIRRHWKSRAALSGALALGIVVWGLVAPPVLATGTDAAWSKSQGVSPAVGSSGGGDSNGIAIAANGRAIITGWFQDTVYFPKAADDSFALTSLGGNDVFVAEWDPTSGFFTRAQRAGGTGASTAQAVTLSGSLAIVTGTLGTGTMYFPKSADDSLALTAPGGEDPFVAAWNPATGYFAWAQMLSGSLSSMNYAQSTASSTSGGPLISGFFMGTMYVPRGPGDDSISLTNTSQGGFVAALKSRDDSYFAWAQAINGTSYVLADAIAVTGTNDPVLTGSFDGAGTAVFPTGPATSIALPAGGGNQSLFVAAMTGDDSYFKWAQKISGGATANLTSGSIAMKSNGTPVASGYFSGTIYLPKAADDSFAFTSTANEEAFVAATRSADDSYFGWALPIRGTAGGGVQALDVAVNSSGESIVTGLFTKTAYFPTGAGDDSLALAGDDTVSSFVAGVKADGSGFNWALKPTGTGRSVGFDVATTAAGNPITAGYFNGTVTFASTLVAQGSTAGSPLPNPVVRNPFVASIALGSTPPPDPGPGPDPAPVYPPSAPTGVTATAGDASAKLSWMAPASSGSFPISQYMATSTPGGRSCLVAAPTLSCDVVGLTNGTPYTFTVKALNGAGWSSESAASNAVTPKGVDPSPRTITISGSRSGVKVIVTGSTTGMSPGAILKPWFRFPGQTAYTEGMAQILVRDEGTFAWERRTGKRTAIYLQTPDGRVKSNTVVIEPR